MSAVGRTVNTGLLWLEGWVEMFWNVGYLQSQICKVSDTFGNLIFKMPFWSTPALRLPTSDSVCKSNTAMGTERYAEDWVNCNSFQKLLKNNWLQKWFCERVVRKPHTEMWVAHCYVFWSSAASLKPNDVKEKLWLFSRMFQYLPLLSACFFSK